MKFIVSSNLKDRGALVMGRGGWGREGGGGGRVRRRVAVVGKS